MIEDLVESIKKIFPDLAFSVSTFHSQTTFHIKKHYLKDLLLFLKNNLKPGYEVLMDLTAVDYLVPEKRTEVLYFLHNPSTYARLIIKVSVLREEELPSITDIWEGADWYERELFDLFGIRFVGHPDMKRLLMPDDWIGHPLLRDYLLTEESVEFKNGVKPKIPSQIIPYVPCSRKN